MSKEHPAAVSEQQVLDLLHQVPTERWREVLSFLDSLCNTEGATALDSASVGDLAARIWTAAELQRLPREVQDAVLREQAARMVADYQAKPEAAPPRWWTPGEVLRLERAQRGILLEASAIVAEVGGTRQYVQFLSGGVVGVSAADGKLLWRYNAPANSTANCSTPIFRDGCVFAASAYRTGGGKAKITKDGTTFSANEEFFLDSFQNQHGGMVLVGDYVYGTNNGSLLCVNFKDGTVSKL